MYTFILHLLTKCIYGFSGGGMLGTVVFTIASQQEDSELIRAQVIDGYILYVFVLYSDDTVRGQCWVTAFCAESACSLRACVGCSGLLPHVQRHGGPVYWRLPMARTVVNDGPVTRPRRTPPSRPTSASKFHTGSLWDWNVSSPSRVITLMTSLRPHHGNLLRKKMFLNILLFGFPWLSYTNHAKETNLHV